MGFPLSAKISKLMDKYFKEKNPPMYISPEERESLRETLRHRLSRLKNVNVDRYSYDKKDEYICEFSIMEPLDSRAYWHSSFTILVNENNELIISHYGKKSKISSIEDLFEFIGEYQSNIEAQNAVWAKKEKIKELKIQAVTAHVKKIARQEKFDFCVTSDTFKIKLFVKMSEKHCIELQIPFNQIEEILPKLHQEIKSLKEVYSNGIRFGMKEIQQYSIYSWIKYESLPLKS